MAVTRTSNQSAESPRDGNALALFVDGVSGQMRIKDIYGNVENIMITLPMQERKALKAALVHKVHQGQRAQRAQTEWQGQKEVKVK